MLVEDYFGHWLQVLDRQEVTHMNNFLSTLYKLKSNVYPVIQKDIETRILFGNSADTLERNLSSSLQTVKNCLLREEFWPEKIIFDSTLESQAKQ